jgi:hypothetical protein
MPVSPRNRPVRVWLAASALLAVSGCALIGGLDQYVKGDAEAPDAVADQTVGDVAQPDVVTPDSGGDVTPPDAGGDVVSDVQDGGITDAADAGDSCGPLNTIDNCTMCGAQCDGTNASGTQCNGTTCVYTCKTGYSNCDAAAPDLNGCECATPTCCGASCATTHMNGVGQNYYDCVDAGTHDQTQAAKACTAYTNDQFACSPGGCIGADGGATGDLVICNNPDAGSCICWDYQGPDIGYVHQSGNTNCFCPNTNDFKWN